LLEPDASRCPTDGGAVEAVETLTKGVRIGQYKIDRILSRGGMGFVYEATHELLNRRSAIKMLRAELAANEQVVTRFLNEAKAVNLIDHQNIVNVYDYGDGQAGSVYFVMEFLEGQTLDELMRKRQPMQMPLLLHVFGQIAKALAAAHAKKIVHRDLKPANVYVIARDHNPYFIKLLDFGIAQLRSTGGAQGHTRLGMVMGTPQYMSPEQISGGAVDARSDVWALGVMLYRAATGHAPFKGEALADLTDKILHQSPRPAGEIVSLPATLSKLIASCLEPRLEERCRSLAEVIAGLEQVKQECRLDDDAILAAVKADAGALKEPLPPRRREPTRNSLAGSLPQYQGVPHPITHEPRPAPAEPPRRRSRLGRYLILCGLAAAGYVFFGRGEGPRPAPQVVVPPAPGPAAPPTIYGRLAAGDRAGMRQLAEQGLRGALTSGRLQLEGFAVDALAVARVPAVAPLLYLALQGPPDVRVKAARALGGLALPDSVSKVRAALGESGDKIKTELAAALYRLGDKDARAVLERATEDPSMRLTAALALTDAGDEGGQAVLMAILAATPPGREPWRRAAGGLVKLGDANARKLLEGELARPEPERSIGAAELLARAGDAKARALLARVAADLESARPGDAAMALARLGDKRALGRVAQGLASHEADERRLALAICGALAADAQPHTESIAKLATDDPDLHVRLTAEAVLLGL